MMSKIRILIKSCLKGFYRTYESRKRLTICSYKLEGDLMMIMKGVRIDYCYSGQAHRIVVPVRLSSGSREIECDQLLNNFWKLESPMVAKKTSKYYAYILQMF